MSDMPLGDCESLPQVALTFMNSVHCEELTLVSALLALVKTDPSSTQIDKQLDAWLAHTQAHFSREERFMEEYQFPPYPVHQGEHTLALNTLEGVITQWKTNRDATALRHYIEVDWYDWLQQHISTMDTVTALYLSQFDIQVEL